jgi:hypothetical protein
MKVQPTAGESGSRCNSAQLFDVAGGPGTLEIALTRSVEHHRLQALRRATDEFLNLRWGRICL